MEDFEHFEGLFAALGSVGDEAAAFEEKLLACSAIFQPARAETCSLAARARQRRDAGRPAGLRPDRRQCRFAPGSVKSQAGERDGCR